MSTRLSSGGRLIDRSSSQHFCFNGKQMSGYMGDTLASALLANGQMLLGRSFKYHRPRGVVASGAEEPNALMNLGAGARLEPNQRATTTELFDGLTATSQNHWPSLNYDIGEINNYFSRFLSSGFYYKTFMYPRAAWKYVFEPVIRHSAGLGKAPQKSDPDHYEYAYGFCDLLVVGGGISGVQAALMAARAGARVWLIEQNAHWGGRAPVDGDIIDGKSADDWVKGALHELASMPNVTLRNRTMAAGLYDHGYVLLDEKLSDHTPEDGRPKHRVWRMRTHAIISATGAIERPLSFAGNDIPGVMLASAMRDYLVNWAVAPGQKTAVVTNNDDGYRTAIAMCEAGLGVCVVVDARREVTGELPEKAKSLGIRIETGKAIARVKGRLCVEAVEICQQEGDGAASELIACDGVAMSGGWSPVVHLWSHCGGKLLWDDEKAMFIPDSSRAPTGADGAPMVYAVGAANGEMYDVLADTYFQMKTLLQALGQTLGFERGDYGPLPDHSFIGEKPILPVWVMPQAAPISLRSKMFLDYQNDVKVSDVNLAAREGYQSVEHTKRYTTLGMATDQGKLSNINGLAILANSLGSAIPNVGTTTFRPPYTPVTIGALIGEARGALFQPLRKTPMHEWHHQNQAYFEPVGLWYRPYCFMRPRETHEAAVYREVKNTRKNLGLLDASTLGKIIVKGPDAGKFLDMLYTNVMSSLGVGKCRYGLMCNEQGFLIDDGVVARIDEDSWLCHTTSGGADRIHAWMEDWLQCEWWDWQVYTANITEQYAQIAVVGPNARKLLEKLGGMDVSKEALAFMHWADGTLGGFPARVYRISFSGELSYEVAVPAHYGLAFWQACIDAGDEFGVMPYGTEALHIMRAEKGFIMIGDETDGTVIPQDLGLGWAISKKKTDFLGKRGQERSYLSNPERWKLVGFETLDGSVIPDGAYVLEGGRNGNNQANVQGRVTSSYHSPTLERGIAMGLLYNGPARFGEVVEFTNIGGEPIKAKVVSPVFYDPEGEKQNV